MRRALPASLLSLVAALAIGVGSAGAAQPAPHPVVAPPNLTVVAPVQADCAATGPAAGSACRPDGYRAASQPFGAPLGLSGSSIHLSHHGAVFIEGFEGFSSCPYRDPVGVATRGFGETEGISMGSACITRSFGERNLIFRAERFYGWAIRGMGVSFNQNQADALFSFAWNLGAGIFTGELRRQLQHHDPYGLLAYDHAGGQVLAGLSRRRRAEVALFLAPAHEETPAQRRARVHGERVARLHSDYRARHGLDVVLVRYNCLRGYRHFSRDHARKCTAWRARHGAVQRDIKHLHRLGIW